MNPTHPQNPQPRNRAFKQLTAVGLSLLTLAGLPFVSRADGNWTGSAADNNWDNLSNWSADPSGAAAFVNTNNNRPIVTGNNTVVIPNDIKIGASPGTTGRVDVVSGTLNYNYWSFIGDWDGNGTLNIADTSTSGGAFTGYGLGSGSYVSANAAGNANLQVGLYQSTGVINMNTTGTLDTQNLNISPNGQAGSGTVNLDNGTVNVTAEVQVGSSFWGNGTTSLGYLNMSGGTVTANIVSVARGDNNSASIKGSVNMTGGTLNSKQWFTLAFAGSSSLLAAVTNNGGTININTTGGGNLEMGVWDPANTRFVVNSGAVTLQNNASMIFGVLGQSGTGTFEQNGGTVAFYSDAGTILGGTGGIVLGNQGAQPWEISSGTYNYNLNGGTLTVPQISKTSVAGTGNFNFNGGTLKPTATTATFMQGLSAANVNVGGAKIDTAGFDITVGQALSGTGAVTKLGLGTLTLSGASTYTGNTVISNGTLALSGTATLASQVVIPASRTLDVTALTVGLQNPVSGVGAVNGSATAAVGMDIYPATDGTVGTLTFNNDLNLNAGGSLRLDLSTSHLSGNDQVVVSGNLTVSSATAVRIKALSGAANLSTAADYVLCSVAGTTTMATTPSLAWDGTPPANYLSFSVRTNGQNLVLHYTAATAPTVTATGTPATLVRNQKVTVTATVTPGTGSVTNVLADASQIGGSATAQLVLSGTPNVYTNTFTVAANTAPGVKLMAVVAYANTGLSSPAYTVTNTVVATNEVWTGAGANDNWSTSPNWSIVTPASSGDAVTFAGTTRLTPNLDANFSVTGVTFDATAGGFNLGTANSSTLTLTANGILNLSANPQTVNVPVIMSAGQTINGAVGTLIFSNTITKGNLLTVTGAANTVISGPITDSGSLFKKGSGVLTVTTNSTWDMNQASSGGFSGPLIAQAGTVKFTGGSVQTVTGEPVIGGVIANGGAGNDARIIVDNATMNVSSWLSVGRGNGVGGVSSDLILTNGAVVTAANTSAGFNGGNGANKPKGSISLYDTSSLTIAGDFHVAEAGGGNFSVNVNGTSTLSYGNFMDFCIGFGGTIANMNVNGGTVNCGGDAFIGHWGDGDATLTINNGAFNFGTTGTKWLFMGYWDYVKGTININGGSMNLWNNSQIHMARNINNAGNTFGHVINHNAGDVTFFSDGGVTPGGSGLLDMHYDGAATNVTCTYNLNGGTLDVPAITSTVSVGGRIFNFNGGTLKAGAAGTLMDLGTGNAHAYVRTGGAVINDNGNSVTIATALEHFSGDPADSGLTKKGAGLLSLTGTNSYTGNTVVQAGTLQLAQPGLAATSSVSVSNAAILQLDFATTNQVSALVLNGVSQAAGVYNNANAATYLTGTGSLLVQAAVASNPTNITFSASGGSLSLSWPADHLGWILQAQTNSRAIGLTTSWIDLPGSASVTSTNFPINPAAPTVFYRLRIP